VHAWVPDHRPSTLVTLVRVPLIHHPMEFPTNPRKNQHQTNPQFNMPPVNDSRLRTRSHAMPHPGRQAQMLHRSYQPCTPRIVRACRPCSLVLHPFPTNNPQPSCHTHPYSRGIPKQNAYSCNVQKPQASPKPLSTPFFAFASVLLAVLRCQETLLLGSRFHPLLAPVLVT
jgi:hypothetical protein